MSGTTLPEAVELLDDMLREYHRLSRLTLATMQHLLAEQADAVAPRPSSGDQGGGDVDVMLSRMAALAPYAYRGRQITSSLGEVKRSLRDWQRALDQAISDRRPPDDDRPRCPGTMADADGRLGGCGNLTDKYYEGGAVKYRTHCKKCRTQGKHT